MIKSTPFKILLFILLSTVLFSCTKKDNNEKTGDNTSTKSATSLETASKRAEERWNSLINKDWGKAYLYESPSYRKNYTIDNFKGGFGGAVTWKSVKIISNTKVNEKLTDIKVQLTFTFTEGGAKMEIPSMFDERWILSDGQWFHVIKK